MRERKLKPHLVQSFQFSNVMNFIHNWNETGKKYVNRQKAIRFPTSPFPVP